MIVVTGGAGYIGSVVLQSLERLCKSPAYCLDNLTYADDYNRYAFANIDITDREKLHAWLDKHPTISCIVHLAAIVGDGACNVDPERTMAVNVEGTRNIVDYIKSRHDKISRSLSSASRIRLVYASTCSVYGASDDLITEESVANPISLYAESKLIGEGIVKEVDDHLIFRLGTIYGLSVYPGSYRIRSDLVINAMSFSAVTQKRVQVFGPLQWRPFIHVMDVGRLIAQGTIGSYRGTYILANENMQLGEVANLVKVLNSDVEVLTFDGKARDLRNYRVDSSKARAAGFIPDMSVEYGIKQMRHAVEEGRIKNPWLPKYNNENALRGIYHARG
jgi:nucleoside-diphosphate-sugar epimerase